MNENFGIGDIIDIKNCGSHQLKKIFDITGDFLNIEIKKVEFNEFICQKDKEEQDFDDLLLGDLDSEQEEKQIEEEKGEKKYGFKVLEFSGELDKELVSSIFELNEDYIFNDEGDLILFL